MSSDSPPPLITLHSGMDSATSPSQHKLQGLTVEEINMAPNTAIPPSDECMPNSESVFLSHANAIASDDHHNKTEPTGTIHCGDVPVLKPSRKVTQVVAEVLGNAQVHTLKLDNKSLSADNRRLKRLLAATNEFLADVLHQKITVQGSTPVTVPPNIHICNYCYSVCRDDEGGICSCGATGYCSADCQFEHWCDDHKYHCPFGHPMEEVD